MTELHKQVVFIIERQTKILLLLEKENVNKSEPMIGRRIWLFIIVKGKYFSL